jgi:hypothetical protein
MQQRLSLFSAATPISVGAMFFNLRLVPSHGAPSLDLAFIIWTSAAHEVSAIPLKPAARIFPVNPTLHLPDAQGL